MTAISVIVPIFNMEKLMPRCIDSILCQTFSDFEILLVDDGSTDKSSRICDEYALKDNRVRVYHKPNGGLSDARNFGLANATGEYTIFFDPDDWVEKDCLEALYAKALETDADVVMCDIFYNDKYQQKYGNLSPTSCRHRDILKDLIVGKVHGYTVNKLVRRKCYLDFDLSYPVGIYGCEDQYVMCSLYMHDIKTAYINQAYYHYYFKTDSLSRTYNDATLKNDIICRDLFVMLLKDTDLESLVFQVKSSAIVSRAFLFGRNVYSSKEFSRTFMPYKEYLMGSPFELSLYRLSLTGMYHFTRDLYGFLFSMKQLYKKTRFLLRR